MCPTLDSIDIEPPSLVDIFLIPPLFKQAVNVDFAFYNEKVKNRIVQRNSLFSLFFAKFRKNRSLFVAKINRKCVGIIIASHNAQVGTIHWLFVSPEFRDKKIGTRLVEAVEKKLWEQNCQKITLTTETVPTFYKNLGYQEEGVLKKHWWGKDFTILSKIIVSN